MAITLTSQLTDENLDPGSPTKFGNGNAQSSETVINLEGANCAAIGHSGSLGPTSPVTADSQAASSSFRGCYSAINVARDHNHIHFWVRDLYPIRNKSIGGISVYLANGTTAEMLYYATGLDAGYGGGWYHGVANLSTTDRAAADLGSLPTGNIDRIGYAGNISASKGENFLQNCYLDAIRYGADGVGISFYGGTPGARETFAACAAADTASYGLLRSVGGVLFCDGCLTFGVATQTTYIQDLLGGINFTAFTNGGGSTPIVAADYYRIVLADGTTGVTNLDLIDWTWKGVSRSLPFRFTSNLGVGDAYTSLRSQYIFAEDITLDQYCTSTDDVFIECQTIIPAGITLTSPGFANCDAVTLTAANDLISGGQTALHNTLTAVPFVTTDDFDKIIGHDFDNTGGVGHAVDLGIITATRSDTCNGNLFGGYSTTVNGNKAVKVHVNTGVTYTINATNGSDIAANKVYNSGPGTLVVQNSVTVQVTVLDNATGLAIENARVQIYLTSDYSTSVLNGGTNASGIVSTSYAYSGDAGVEGWVRQFDIAGTDYVQKDISGTITANGLFLTVRLDPVT